MPRNVTASALLALSLPLTVATADVISFTTYRQSASGTVNVGELPSTAGVFGIRFEYDTESNEVIECSFPGWPIGDFSVDEGDTIENFSVNGDTHVYMRNSNGQEAQVILTGDLRSGQRLEFVPYDPVASSGSLSLLNIDAASWGTMFLWNIASVFDERGGPTAEDLISTPGVSFFVHQRPLPPNCNAADVAAPFGVLDLADVDAFVVGFSAAESTADVAFPFGVLDLADIDAFIASFLTGCP